MEVLKNLNDKVQALEEKTRAAFNIKCEAQELVRAHWTIGSETVSNKTRWGVKKFVRKEIHTRATTLQGERSIYFSLSSHWLKHSCYQSDPPLTQFQMKSPLPF